MVFRSQTAEMPAPDGSVFRTNPYRTAKLSEEQIQELLAFALGEGNLGVARAQYDNPMVTDVGTSTFTVDAGGLKKTVSVYALGMEIDGVPDQLRRVARSMRWRPASVTSTRSGSIATDVYEPTAYRGILMDGQGMVVPDVRAWPWDDIEPADFAGPADPNAFQLATRTLTPAEADALEVEDSQGGFQGMVMNGPGDGKLYSFALRPLLPDETE